MQQKLRSHEARTNNNSKINGRWRQLSRRRRRLFLCKRQWWKNEIKAESIREDRVAHESALIGNRGERTRKLSEPIGESNENRPSAIGTRLSARTKAKGKIKTRRRIKAPCHEIRTKIRTESPKNTGNLHFRRTWKHVHAAAVRESGQKLEKQAAGLLSC